MLCGSWNQPRQLGKSRVTLSEAFLGDRKTEIWESTEESLIGRSETEILGAGRTASGWLFNNSMRFYNYDHAEPIS